MFYLITLLKYSCVVAIERATIFCKDLIMYNWCVTLLLECRHVKLVVSLLLKTTRYIHFHHNPNIHIFYAVNFKTHDIIAFQKTNDLV